MKNCTNKYWLLGYVPIVLALFLGVLSVGARYNYTAHCALSTLLQFRLVTHVRKNLITHYPEGYRGGLTVQSLAFRFSEFVGHYDMYGLFVPCRFDVSAGEFVHASTLRHGQIMNAWVWVYHEFWVLEAEVAGIVLVFYSFVFVNRTRLFNRMLKKEMVANDHAIELSE